MYEDIQNNRFGSLVAVRPTEKRTSSRGVVWLCKCDCGKYTEVSRNSLRSGNTKSCGCKALEGRKTKHGGANWPEYNVWKAMRRRCSSEKDKKYKDYGGRGISVCPRWNDSFASFIGDMGRRPSSRHTLERIDNNGNYSPENCRWATYAEQNINRRVTVRVDSPWGVTTIPEAADRLGVPHETLRTRIRLGYTGETLFSKDPLPVPNSRLVFCQATGIFYESLREAYRAYNFNVSQGGLWAKLAGKAPNTTSLQWA